MLSFRLAGVPVSVHLSFLLLAFFGWLRFEDPMYTAAWTIGVFFAILAHEAGHAFTARGFGAPGVRIMLFAFGGATTYPLITRITPGRRFLISAAGSAVGIATGAALMAFGTSQGWFDVDFGGWPPYERISPDFLSVMAVGYIEAALFWGILNWLPMRPLDGGQMVQSLLEMVVPSIAEQATRAVSLVIGVPVIIWALLNQQLFIAMIVGFMLMSGLRGQSTASQRSQPQAGSQAPASEGDAVASGPSHSGSGEGAANDTGYPPDARGDAPSPGSGRRPDPADEPPEFPI
jgi:Zn-dependent protease